MKKFKKILFVSGSLVALTVVSYFGFFYNRNHNELTKVSEQTPDIKTEPIKTPEDPFKGTTQFNIELPSDGGSSLASESTNPTPVTQPTTYSTISNPTITTPTPVETTPAPVTPSPKNDIQLCKGWKGNQTTIMRDSYNSQESSINQKYQSALTALTADYSSRGMLDSSYYENEKSVLTSNRDKSLNDSETWAFSEMDRIDVYCVLE